MTHPGEKKTGSGDALPMVDWSRMMGTTSYDSLLRSDYRPAWQIPRDEYSLLSLPEQPSRRVMEERWAFRNSIRQQSLQQRRIHKHGRMGDTGCNIVWSLLDRESRGARACVVRSRSQMQRDNSSDEDTMASDGDKEQKVYSRGEHHPMRIFREIRTFVEYYSVVRYHSSYLHHLGGRDSNGNEENDSEDTENDGDQQRPSTSSPAVSTISIAFSPDAQTMASTHGDHTVKISCCSTGRLMETLEGHPRTPWTVKYHPTDPHVLASGCLGFQVRVWNWPDKNCLHMIRLHHAIISLSFHPSGHVLAIASGSRLHFWDYNNEGGLTRRGEDGKLTRSSRGVLTEVEQRHMLRCVHFPPGGDTVIVGGMNPTSDDPRRIGPGRGGMSGGGMSFYLRLWDFSLYAALHPYTNNGEGSHPNGSTNLTGNRLIVHRKVLKNPRTFVPRALLYNDGGFDVSPDGKVLCACAEYWLPDGVNSAMELLQKEEESNNDASDDDVGEETRENNDDKAETTGEPEGSSDAPVSTADTGETEGQTNDGASSPTRNLNTSTPADDNSFSSPPRQQNPSHVRNVIPPPPSLPITPPNPNRSQPLLSPPSPPGRRWIGGLGQRRAPVGGGSAAGGLHTFGNTSNSLQAATGAMSSIPPPPPGPRHQLQLPAIKPHPLSVVAGGPNYPDVTSQKGRYVPHIVTVSLDTAPISSPADGGPVQGRGQMTSVAKGHRPRLGQLLEACPLDGAKASGVTCVKFSPSADFCLLGYGVREPQVEGDDHRYHPVTALYRVRGGMTHVSTMLSGDDDVNIARFHPDSGYGFVYGTKQGRVRVLSPRPWNYYNC